MGEIETNGGIKLMLDDGQVVSVPSMKLDLSTIVPDTEDTDEQSRWQPLKEPINLKIGGFVAPTFTDEIQEMFDDIPRKVDVLIAAYPGKLPRKMKKAYRSDLTYLNTKWKRKVFNYIRKRTYKEQDAEFVITKQDMETIEAEIKFAKMSRECDSSMCK